MSNSIKILSYNIFWRAMVNSETAAGITEDDAKNKVQLCKTDPSDKAVTVCLSNVVKLINNNGPYDFVGLQEATNWKLIQERSSDLQNISMNTCSIKFGDPILNTTYKENMVTFYNKKYILDSDINTIKGFLQDAGRPFIILFFNNNLCVINMHSGHHALNSKEYKNNGDLNDLFTIYLPKFINKFDQPEIYKKINTYDLIVMGDMNNHLPKTVIVGDNRKLFNVNKIPTCCDKSLLNSRMGRSYDHILSTYKNIKYEKNITKNMDVPASDHLPVIAIITTKTESQSLYKHKYLKYKKKYMDMKK